MALPCNPSSWKVEGSQVHAQPKQHEFEGSLTYLEPCFKRLKKKKKNKKKNLLTVSGYGTALSDLKALCYMNSFLG